MPLEEQNAALRQALEQIARLAHEGEVSAKIQYALGDIAKKALIWAINATQEDFEKRTPLWTAQATRRNVDGKPDYVWTRCYADGRPVLYVTESDAYAAASSACADTAHGLHTPRATLN